MEGESKKGNGRRIDPRELKPPETIMIRDIEDKVFQGIVIKTLEGIEGVALVEGSLIDHLLGRDLAVGVKGIHIEQDSQGHSVKIKVEVRIGFGFSIPDKAEEIQTKLIEQVTHATGLHVSSVHVVFRDLIPVNEKGKVSALLQEPLLSSNHTEGADYNDDF